MLVAWTRLSVTNTTHLMLAEHSYTIIDKCCCCGQERTQIFLEQLSSGFTLQLAATRAATSAGGAAQERISKTVHVRMRDPDTGATVLRERSLRCVHTACNSSCLACLTTALL